jgi:hypothetical protein
VSASPPRIAVLGAGIMGASLALYLARRGARVTLFDKAAAPLAAASRWNEGKIHLGFLYNADPSLDTARHVLPGGLLFRPLVEDLLACDLGPVITAKDDIYLCHRDSVVPPEAMAAYMKQASELLRDHPDARHYLADASRAEVRPMSAAELSEASGSDAILAGFHVPERSVQTTWVAERYVAALKAEPRIELMMRTRVTGLVSEDGGHAGPWRVETATGVFAGYDYAINALWEGRLEIDRGLGLPPPAVWSNRYRESLFLRSTRALDLPCAIIATGPFGDVKNYNGRDFYLSWYPDGLLTDSSELAPPDATALPRLPKGDFVAAVLGHLGPYLPWVTELHNAIESVTVEGGWVFAAGRGQLSAASSSLHRRSKYGVARRGTYLSIDTGKYSTAPWLARRVVEEHF